MKAMPKPSLLLAAVALATISGWSGAARADIPPTCAAQDSLITCAAADVGKPCQGGGECYEIQCSNGSSSGKVYKCDACPTVLPSADECSIPNLGQPCTTDGGTGTCLSRPNHCVTTGTKFACLGPAGPRPTGPPSGGAAGTGGGSSGCDIAPNPPKPTMIGLSLVGLGLALLLIERARRRSRR